METKTTGKPKPAIKQSLTLNSLNIELQSLRELVEAHSHALSELQEAVSRKKKPPNTNGKVQIRDKKTGKVYPRTEFVRCGTILLWPNNGLGQQRPDCCPMDLALFNHT